MKSVLLLPAQRQARHQHQQQRHRHQRHQQRWRNMAKSVIEMTIDMEMFDYSNLKNAEVPLKGIADKGVKQIKKQIRQRISWDGRFYNKLAKKTLKDKAREGHTSHLNTPLRRTGLLYNAIQYRKGRSNTYYIGIAAVGDPRRDILALIHQYEGVNKHARIKRPFFGLSMKFHKEAALTIKRWVNKQLSHAKKRRIKIK